MSTDRTRLIGDAAIEILADLGMRGLTHRAVDAAAGLPAGSTSNLARSRAALLELALARLTELEDEHFAELLTQPLPVDRREAMVELLAVSTYKMTGVDRRRSVARYELALEATRRPELRAVYDDIGRRYREPSVAMFAAAGTSDPARHGRQLVAFTEGLLFDAVVGAGGAPTLGDLRAAFAEYLSAVFRDASPT
ncbi:TetR/AcrR family transcriptional regulator [Herbidospora mongoliensis]|uniref:TetR/AcrR family transcriptional regulator n=1 Tax=Herbidospora mongoliensis TaxID=688067 RepID=UPI001FDFF5C7|nr:TetR/AcrR family transcriptional regulator [Herbidospora mongoliensis]